MSDETDRYNYHGYTIKNVYRSVSEELRSEIVEMWLRNRVLPNREEAIRRVDQVVLSMRNPEGGLAGVSTVYVDDFQQRGNRYFFYRMFIQPPDRIPGMMRHVILVTRDILEANYTPGGPIGLIHVNENPKLMRPGIRSMFARHDYEYFGQTSHGHDIWRYLFKSKT